MKYLRVGDFVALKSGVLNHRTSLTFFDKVQAIRISQSLFDRRWDMATLSVDTAASGPTVHRIHVFYLEAEFAQQEYESMVAGVARRKPVFG